MQNRITDYKSIKGWAIDADPKNDPTYPMKHRTNEEQKGYSWDRPTQQQASVEVLHSNERPNLTAVYGTSTPPSGLSGLIRRYAFKYSESSYGHWLPLLLADRINVVEGVIDDLKQGHVPNIFAEKGWKWDWQHNRKGLTQKIVTGAVIVSAVAALVYLNKRSDKD